MKKKHGVRQTIYKTTESRYYLPQHALPKSSRTNCTMYGSSKLTYHHGTRSGFVNEHVSAV